MLQLFVQFLFSHLFHKLRNIQYAWCACVPVGIGPVHMNEVECSGFEKSLTECHFNREAVNCNHDEDAAVKCNIPAMGFNNRVSFYFNWVKQKMNLLA